MIGLSLFDSTLSLHLAISLLHFLWQGLLISLVVVVCDATIGRKRAHVRYAVNFSALMLMLICLLVTFGLVAIRAPRALNGASLAPTTTFSDTALLQSEPEALSQLAIDSAEPSVATLATPPAAYETSQAANVEAAFFESWAWLAPYVTVIYLIGFTLMTVRFAVAFIGGDRLRRSAKVVTDPLWLDRLEKCIGQIKCSVHPTLMTCDRIATPLIVGVLKPVVLMPASLLTELASSQLENILLHELAHLRRYDNLMNLFQRVVETLLFFHPAVWYVSHRVSNERENCCDDLVLSVGAEPSGYAETLIRVVELGQHRARLAAGATLAVDGNRKTELRTRVSRVMGVDERTPFRSSRFATVTVFAVMTLLAASVWSYLEASQVAQQNPEGTLTVALVDSSGVAVEGAEVEIKDWDDDWVDTDYRGTSDKNGEVVFENFKPGYYPLMLVKHKDFAPILQPFSFEKGTAARVAFKLLKAEVGSLRVISSSGEPIAGAMITGLNVSNTESNLKMKLSHRQFEMLTDRPSEDFVSDASGLIFLPPLPVGSSVRAKVLHPHWKSTKTEEANIETLKSTTVVMEQGTIVTAKLVGDDSVLKELEGKNIDVRLFINSMTRGVGYEIAHLFPVKDGAIEFCLEEGQYDGFGLGIEGFSITPRFGSTLQKFEFTNIPAVERINRNFVVRRNYVAKGRAVTEQGAPVAEAEITALVQNLFVDKEQKLSSLTENKFDYSFAKTDANGYYEIEIPEGPTRFIINWGGGSPEDSPVTDFQNGQTLPDLVLDPPPVITGKIVAADGRPVGGAIARVISSFCETKYVTSDKDGNFEIKLKGFEYDMETEARLDHIKVVAFDPHGPLAGIVDVDLSDKSKHSALTMELVEQAPGWIEDEIKKTIQAQSAKMLAKMGVDQKELEEQYADEKGIDLEQLKEKHKNKDYDLAPEFAGGTWFNTDSDSLKDFRGQYVLIDFWFIGCGPCERQIPSLKKVYNLYREQGFAVISVHRAGQPPESVKQFCDARGMNFPLVVDGVGEEILKAYRPLGVEGFPTYLLINPEGQIVPAYLHSLKIETIRRCMLQKDAQSPSKLNGD